MANRFYRIKEICLDLGISVNTLRDKIRKGILPPLEQPNPINTRVVGYSHDTYQSITKMIASLTNLTNLTNDVNINDV